MLLLYFNGVIRKNGNHNIFLLFSARSSTCQLWVTEPPLFSIKNVSYLMTETLQLKRVIYGISGVK